MKETNVRTKLLAILDIAPKLKEILLSEVALEDKRQKIRMFLAENLAYTFEDTPSIPPLEWILTREAIQAFRGIISSRNEKIVGFGFLQFVDGLLNGTNPGTMEKTQPGFFLELEHLIRGISGKTEIYNREKTPSFSKYSGKKASKLRSDDLSRMARNAEKFKARYSN